MALDIMGFLPSNNGSLVFPLIMFLVFAITVIFHIVSLNSLISSKTPKMSFENLVFKKDMFPFMENSAFMREATSGVSIGGDVLRIDVCNKPKNPTEENHAKSVSAIITYYDCNGRFLINKSRGRWASGEYPKSSKSISKVLPIEISSSGSPEKLDLAIMTQLMDMKKEVYAFNNELLFVESEKKLAT